jgi:hypothetical protein
MTNRQDRPRTPGIARVSCVRMESKMSMSLSVWRVIGFLYVESHRLFCILTDMYWKTSACFGLCVDMVPMAYQ